jgi:hypothetical protein
VRYVNYILCHQGPESDEIEQQPLRRICSAESGRARRVEMIQDLTNSGMGISDAAAHGVMPPTVRKWPGRYLAQGEAEPVDASSRPSNREMYSRAGMP